MTRVARRLALPFVVALFAAPAAHATVLHLPADASLRIDGGRAGDHLGTPKSAGDVNGDGHPDLLVTAPGADNQSKANSGSAYVVFGPRTGPFNILNLAAGGFRIDGAAAGQMLTGAGTVGDVNGDGKADILVFTSAPRQGTVGHAWIVFGKSSPGTVNLASLGSGGYRIDGRPPIGTSTSLFTAAPAGDVNHDGKGDVIVGDVPLFFTSPTPTAPPEAAVVFGKTSTSTLEIDALGSQGFRIVGPQESRFGQAVDGAGDVNGDGFGDVIVGNPDSEGDFASVIFGKATTGDVDSSDPNQIAITEFPGFLTRDNAFGFVAGAGDVNHDGLADVIVSVQRSFAGPSGGYAAVVFGSSTPRSVRLACSPAAGCPFDPTKFLMTSPDQDPDPSGNRFASVFGVDGGSLVNADDFTDLVVEQASSATSGVDNINVVFGKSSSSNVKLDDLRPGGPPPKTNSPGFVIGSSTLPHPLQGSSIGDFVGSGFGNVGVGAPNANSGEGQAFVVAPFRL